MKHEEPFRFPENLFVEEIVEHLRVIDECKREILNLKNSYQERIRVLTACLESREDMVAAARRAMIASKSSGKGGKRENRSSKGR